MNINNTNNNNKKIYNFSSHDDAASGDNTPKTDLNLIENHSSPEQNNLESISKGFKINHMKMKDGSNGNVLWEKSNWNLEDDYHLQDFKHKNLNSKEVREMNKIAFKSHNENLPKELLECKSIVREINFSSADSIENFEIVQNYYLSGELIETTKFHFGFVIPNSTNNWEQIIEAKKEMIPYSILSGKLKVETIFLADGEIFKKNYFTIFYV